MKRIGLMFAGMALPLLAVAQSGVEPLLEDGVYALKVSPNGKWFGSMAGDASIYELEKGEYIYYNECFLGLGNAVADNGMAVGYANDVGALMYQGETYYPESIGGSKYWFCNIHSITPDASMISGIISNPNRDGVTYVPFVAPVDKSGNVGEPTILPYPKKDFFGGAPQYCTAVWMSKDGKTVVGQVQDWRGMYSYPIYYKQGEDGEWSYTLPSEKMFNPEGVEIPRNPYYDEPVYPEPEDFMSGVRKDAYLEDYEAFAGGYGPYPDPVNYMTEEQYQKYETAVDEYNDWYSHQAQRIMEYNQVYSKILQASPSFSSNDMAMHPSGDYFMLHGSIEDENGDSKATIYRFSTISDEWSTVTAPSGEYYPYQILPDGTLIITKSIASVPTSYLMLPGSDKFITLQEYFQESHPEISDWLDRVVAFGTGVVIMSDDKSVISGALIPDQRSDYDWDNNLYYYSTYFITLGSAGVESIISEPEDGVYRVYNLQGVKIMETQETSDINSLDKGIYIVNGKKIAVQ